MREIRKLRNMSQDYRQNGSAILYNIYSVRKRSWPSTFSFYLLSVISPSFFGKWTRFQVPSHRFGIQRFPSDWWVRGVVYIWWRLVRINCIAEFELQSGFHTFSYSEKVWNQSLLLLFRHKDILVGHLLYRKLYIDEQSFPCKSGHFYHAPVLIKWQE